MILRILYIQYKERKSEAAMGRVRTQRSVLRVDEPKKTGARSARAHSAARNTPGRSTPRTLYTELQWVGGPIPCSVTFLSISPLTTGRGRDWSVYKDDISLTLSYQNYKQNVRGIKRKIFRNK